MDTKRINDKTNIAFPSNLNAINHNPGSVVSLRTFALQVPAWKRNILRAAITILIGGLAVLFRNVFAYFNSFIGELSFLCILNAAVCPYDEFMLSSFMEETPAKSLSCIRVE